MNRVCATWGPPIFDQPAAVVLTQQGVDRFTVQYGKQVDADLDYGTAALKFGAGVMHYAACDGKRDNREKGER